MTSFYRIFLPLLLLLIVANATQYTLTNLKDAYVSNAYCSACGIDETATQFGSADSTILSIGEIYYDNGVTWIDIGYRDVLMKWDISTVPTSVTSCSGNLTLFTANGLDCSNEAYGAGVNQLITIYESNDFTESSVTWNTLPSTGSQILLAGSSNPYQDGVLKKIQLPLGSFVQSKRSGGATAIYVQIHTTNNEVCNFASKEHTTSSKRPTFVVNCS